MTIKTCAVVSLLTATAFANASDTNSHLNSIVNPAPSDTSNLIVQYAPNVDLLYRQAILNGINASTNDKNRDGIDDALVGLDNEQLAVLSLNGGSINEALASLEGEHAVEFVEQDYIMGFDSLPNDAYFHHQWAHQNTGQDNGQVGADLKTVSAWRSQQDSSDIVIGIIDSGIDYNHEDLKQNIWHNPYEIPNDGYDNDGNGYIDDVHGINAITRSGDPMDDLSHGTHVAGIIGATANNEIGVAGVVSDVQLASCKFISNAGTGRLSDAIACVSYFVGLKRFYNINIVAINNSWGGYGYSRSLNNAIHHAAYFDIGFVAAAGNKGGNSDESPIYPAAYQHDNVLSVASSDRQDEMSSFSNYGAQSIDIAAPGSGIYSTEPNDQYGWLSGTSMSSAYVTGAYALAKAVNPSLTNLDIKEAILASGDNLAAFADKTVSGKRVNLERMMMYVNPNADFIMHVQTPSVIVKQGHSAIFDLQIDRVRDWQGDIDVSIESALMGTTLDTEFGKEILIATTKETPIGSYRVLVESQSGDITKSTELLVRVIPETTEQLSIQAQNNQVIPDNDDNGILASLNNTQVGQIVGASLDLDITHPFIGDLTVVLTSPNGTEFIAHNRSGASSDDIKAQFSTYQFDGEDAQGVWQLHVIDSGRGDEGLLNSWSLTLDIAANPVAQKLNIVIPDKNVQGITNAIYIANEESAELVELTIDIEHSFIKDLIVELESPTGTRVRVHDREGGASDNIVNVYSLYDFAGEQSEGVWLLHVSDHGNDDEGKLVDWSLRTSSNAQSINYEARPEVAIPDKNETGISDSIDVAEAGNVFQMSLSVEISHTYISDLTITLVSPNGNRYTVHERNGGSSDDINETFVLNVVQGEISQGVWSLEVNDQGRGDIGILHNWSLSITQ